MKPKVLALVPDAFGGRGGIAQFSRDLFCALIDRNIVSSLVVLPRHAPETALPPPGVIQWAPRAGRLAYSAAAVWLGLQRNFDTVFCGHLYMAPLALMVARILRSKLIVQMHGIEAWQRPSMLQRAAVEAAELVLCVSRYTRNEVLGWANIRSERILVLPNMVGDGFTPGDGSRLRADWRLGSKYVLLTVGRMDPHERYKGHDRVIQAMPRLLAEGNDVVYVVLGEGADRERLEVCARDQGIADRVLFKGAVDSQTLLDAYRMADLFVMPSTGEGFGIVFLEAMACGTPALGLEVAGALDALADGDLGMLAAEEEFSEALMHAVRQPKPDPQTLHAAVQLRFGRQCFAANAEMAFQRVMGC